MMLLCHVVYVAHTAITMATPLNGNTLYFILENDLILLEEDYVSSESCLIFCV